MNNFAHSTVELGGRVPSFPGASDALQATPVAVQRVGIEDAEAIRAATDIVGPHFVAASPSDKVKLAALVASHVRLAAPSVSTAIESCLGPAPMALFDGMPTGGAGDAVLAAALSMLRGEIFQYAEQLNGDLIATIEPSATGAPNSNSSADPFGFHTDDAIFPARHRVEEISLLSLANPVGTLTGFAALKDVELSANTRELLFQPRFSLKAPNAFSLGGDVWIDGVAILSLNALGEEEIVYPSYNTKTCWKDDHEARRALHELDAALEAAVVDLYLAPGQWVVWNNSTVVHRRGAITGGARRLLRSYIRRDCDAMRRATGHDGPIFSARALLDAARVTSREQSDVA